MENDDLRDILITWGIEYKDTKKRIHLYGSPERSLFRVAIGAADDSIYVLEKIVHDQRDRKIQIARNLLEINTNDLLPQAVPYIPNRQGLFLSHYKGEDWMLSTYIQGIYLDQYHYLNEDWRGQVMADFLLSLCNARSMATLSGPKDTVNPIVDFIHRIEQLMAIYNPAEVRQLEMVLHYLKSDFFEAVKQAPLAFCHGDFHSANIVWGKGDIRGVIDWEFCGYQPELYDVANMLGCLGMENPEVFGRQIVSNFLDPLKSCPYFSSDSWHHFFDLVLALRFAWLSEWFRKKDEEMIDLEIVYMNLLLERKIELVKQWQ